MNSKGYVASALCLTSALAGAQGIHGPTSPNLYPSTEVKGGGGGGISAPAPALPPPTGTSSASQMPVEHENDRLRQLVNAQNRKIEILEARIKELEKGAK